MKEEKDWGIVEHVFQSSDAAISYLQIRANTFCSIHRHRHRYNQFTVIRGTLHVSDFGDGETPELPGYNPTQLYIPEKTIKLERGDSFIVPPDVWHQFVAYVECHVVETYWTIDNSPVDIDDIDRRTRGGSLDD